jgi:hypothetical protein
MSTLNKGRGLEQQTRDGTSSIATMGAGCTGRRNPPQTQDKREHGFQTGTQYRQGEAGHSGPDTVRRSER